MSGRSRHACRVETHLDPLSGNPAERRDESRRCTHEYPHHGHNVREAVAALPADTDDEDSQ